MRKRNPKRDGALAALLACLLGVALVSTLAGAEKKKSKAAPQTLLFGNVFQENGFSLRGARVAAYNAGKPSEKRQTTTDIQGEFALRFPAGKARYTVEVSAEGFVTDAKTVEVAGDERVDMTFRLAPAPK